jgi:CRISPR system Cascade subunit CasB
MQQWMATDAKPLLVVAGVLAAVKQDAHDGHSLVWHMGQSTVGGGTPPMSELRFRRLLKVRRLEEFFTAARRAVALANSARGGADVVILADDLVAWAFERHMREAERPAQTMSFRWAQDYYRPQKGKDVDLTVNSKIEEGERA